MNIVCATDDNFVQHSAVMLASLLANNSNVVVYLLTEGLTLKNQAILKQEVISKGGQYNYVLVDDKIISNLPMPKDAELCHISTATYYRLLISDILPKDVEKVIYLDCDIVIRKSIQDLWDTKIKNYALGAVSQIPTPNGYKRLGYDIRYGYFNAGVLLINLAYWREHNVSQNLISYLTENFSSIKYHDQDALNGLLHQSRFILSCKWNMLFPYFDREILTVLDIENNILIDDFKEYKECIKLERKDPTLVHYTSVPKPWQKGCIHPFRNDYFKYIKLTLNYSEIRPSLQVESYIRIFYRRIQLIISRMLNLIR